MYAVPIDGLKEGCWSWAWGAVSWTETPPENCISQAKKTPGGESMDTDHHHSKENQKSEHEL